MVLAHIAGLGAIGLYGAVGPADAFAADFGFFVLIAGAVCLSGIGLAAGTATSVFASLSLIGCPATQWRAR
jgi:hypothetical protein